MADSITSQIQAALATQVAVTANTGVNLTLQGPPQTVTTYPCAYVWAGIEDDELIGTDLNTYDDWREAYQVIVFDKDPEGVRMCIERLQSLFKPWTSGGSITKPLYDLGVRMVRPRVKRVPSPHDPSANEDYSGYIIFDLDVRYSY